MPIWLRWDKSLPLKPLTIIRWSLFTTFIRALRHSCPSISMHPRKWAMLSWIHTGKKKLSNRLFLILPYLISRKIQFQFYPKTRHPPKFIKIFQFLLSHKSCEFLNEKKSRETYRFSLSHIKFTKNWNFNSVEKLVKSYWLGLNPSIWRKKID